MGVLHLDADDFFWLQTDPPFTTPRNRDERIDLLLKCALPEMSWVFSGAALGWGERIEPLFDLVVFLHTDPALRLQRLRDREMARYGVRIKAGGDMVAKHQEFMDWAARYDTAGLEQRSLLAHEQWLAAQSCSVLRLESSRPVAGLVRDVRAHLAA